MVVLRSQSIRLAPQVGGREAVSLSPQPTSPREAVELAQAMGQTLNTVLLYGVGHKVAQASLERGYPLITEFIERHNQLHFTVLNDELLINGASAKSAPLARNLTGRLIDRHLLSFIMAPGLSFEEYRTFLNLLITPPDPAGAGQPVPLGLPHIEAQNVAYRRVIEGQADPASPEMADSIAAKNTDKIPTDLANVLALLKGDPTDDPNHAREDLQHVAEDAEKLAGLILQAVTLQEQTATIASGGSLTDLLVGCINRVVETLARSSTAKTQKGRKQIKRTLMLLEEKLFAQLQSPAGDATDRDAVSAVFAEATEELDVESLAVKYMKSRRATEKAETRLKKVIRQADGDPLQESELRDRLMEQGLTPEGWKELIVTPEKPALAPVMPGQELKEIKTLTLLLARLGETLARPRDPASGPDDSKIQELIAETGDNLQALATHTEQKINTFRDKASADKEAGQSPALSRKELLEMLAEIAQELSQPLTVINGTLDMLLGQRTGPITPTQSELLTLAAESGAQLGHLVSCLMKIAGTPVSLHPDHDMLQEVYRSGGAPSP